MRCEDKNYALTVQFLLFLGMKRMLVLVFAFLIQIGAFGQEELKTRIDSIRQATILTGDSIPHMELDEVAIFAPPVFKNRRDARRYWRLVYNLKKVLPYSKIVAGVVMQVDSKLSQLETDKQRRQYIKSMEDSLWGQYEADLRKMTVSQGRLLFKLVDRETTSTTYYWIEYYRGKVSAFFWQGVARLFSSNLKSEYDPEGDDKLIEELIGLIEKGYL